MPKPTKNPGTITYTATIDQEDSEGVAAWVVFPHDLKELYGIGNLVPVVATFDGIEYRGSIAKMGPQPLLLIRKDIRAKLGKRGGDTVEVTVTLDDKPRTAVVPEDLSSALAANPAAAREFEAFSYSNRKEYVDWITSAKRSETRERRIAKAVGLIAQGKPLR
jgi:bifunctional DNA-binding transcriptional regulator/antitoxin component of YhaV-PrlF toxin-antitoxin module